MYIYVKQIITKSTPINVSKRDHPSNTGLILDGSSLDLPHYHCLDMSILPIIVGLIGWLLLST